ncbi:MAG TPA: lipid-A-disaccharide synthase N-terminal domain-containing protein [Planctomycetota bacterium]|nr:lipid-A-disaccharide synthase N-terminal domain-containing protein [Planctomycetota bacterium]
MSYLLVTSPTTDALLTAVGWLGQGFYFSRFLIQWYLSERARRIVVPESFWWFSIAGAVMSGVYAFYRAELVFLISPIINLFLHVRNIMLLRSRQPLSRQSLVPILLGVLSLAAVALLFWEHLEPAHHPVGWLVVGVVGQILWTSRFPLQWYASEKTRHVTLGIGFFWISFFGSALLLSFAIHTRTPVFIAGNLLGPILYGRNLILAYRARESEAAMTDQAA